MKVTRLFRSFLVGYLVVQISWVPIAQSTEPRVYEVKRGDTLSEIVRRNVAGPIYGKKGHLHVVLTHNPKIHDADLIFPGQKIILSVLAEVRPQLKAAVPENPKTKFHRKPAALSESHAPTPDPLAHENRVPSELTQSSDDTEPRVPLAETANKFKTYDVLAVSPEFAYRRLDATDRSTGAADVFLSGLDIGASFQWQQVWSEDFQSAVKLGFTKVDYQSGGPHVLDGASKTLSNFGVEGIFKPVRTLSLGFNVNFQQEMFVRSTGFNHISFDSVLVPELGVQASYTMLELDKHKVGIEGSAYLTTSGSTRNYSIDLGHGYQVGLFLDRDFEIVNLRVNLWRSSTMLNTSIANQEETQIGLGFQLGLPIGKPDENEGLELP